MKIYNKLKEYFSIFEVCMNDKQNYILENQDVKIILDVNIDVILIFYKKKNRFLFVSFANWWETNQNSFKSLIYIIECVANNTPFNEGRKITVRAFLIQKSLRGNFWITISPLKNLIAPFMGGSVLEESEITESDINAIINFMKSGLHYEYKMETTYKFDMSTMTIFEGASNAGPNPFEEDIYVRPLFWTIIRNIWFFVETVRESRMKSKELNRVVYSYLKPESTLKRTRQFSESITDVSSLDQIDQSQKYPDVFENHSNSSSLLLVSNKKAKSCAE